ncbi:hypothetical protein [Ensifer sp. 4252]|uniref:hypothetical protein n=1 Tax=Ensifer sp. 4252 TaxID=3373915 RepID=UPI003D234A7A
MIYEGQAQFNAETITVADIPETRTKVMLKHADPKSASRWWRLPADRIGPVGMEFVITISIQIHSMALVYIDRLTIRRTGKTLSPSQ